MWEIRGTRGLGTAIAVLLLGSLVLASTGVGAGATKRNYVNRADAVCKRLDRFDVGPFIRGERLLAAGRLGRAAAFFTKSQRAELREVAVLKRIPKPRNDASTLRRWLSLQTAGARTRLRFARALRRGTISGRLDDRAGELSAAAASISTSYGISCFGSQAH